MKIVMSSGRRLLLLILIAKNRSVTTIVMSMAKITIDMINLIYQELINMLNDIEDKIQ